MSNSHSFVFHEAFQNAIKMMPQEVQLPAVMALVDYGLYDIPYTGDEWAIAMLLELSRI